VPLNGGQPPIIYLERGKLVHEGVMLGQLLVVLPIKSGDPVRDAKAGQGSPLVRSQGNGSGNSFFTAVRLGSTKLVEPGASASVTVVCYPGD
jgi:hypothetical protein